MAFDFPASPSEGQIFAPSGGPQYVYKAPAWRVSGKVDSIIAPVAPSVTRQGQLWVNSTTGNTYVWWDDGNSAAWVQINASVPVPVADSAPIAFTSALTFATPGDTALTNFTQSCRYVTKGSTVWFNMLLQFDLAWTTASGTASFSGPPIMPLATAPVGFSRIDKMIFDSAKMYSADIGTNGAVVIRIATSGGGSANVGTANMPPANGYVFRFSGEYRRIA